MTGASACQIVRRQARSDPSTFRPVRPGAFFSEPGIGRRSVVVVGDLDRSRASVERQGSTRSLGCPGHRVAPALPGRVRDRAIRSRRTPSRRPSAERTYASARSSSGRAGASPEQPTTAPSSSRATREEAVPARRDRSRQTRRGGRRLLLGRRAGVVALDEFDHVGAPGSRSLPDGTARRRR